MEFSDISEQLCNTTVRIISIDNQEKSNCGTGFFFQYSGTDEVYIVTNSHVAHPNVSTFVFDFKVKQNETYHRKSVQIQASSLRWTHHPSHDIAITPVSVIKKQFPGDNDFLVVFIPENYIPNNERLMRLPYIEEITMIGYPQWMMNPETAFPVVRRGITATPLQQSFPYVGKEISMDDTFLIDTAAFGGSSGSPVYIFNNTTYTEDGTHHIGNRTLFVGIMAASYSAPECRTPNDEQVNIPINLGVAIHARKLLDLRP